jgi:hypothetical protein
MLALEAGRQAKQQPRCRRDLRRPRASCRRSPSPLSTPGTACLSNSPGSSPLLPLCWIQPFDSPPASAGRLQLPRLPWAALGDCLGIMKKKILHPRNVGFVEIREISS